MTTDPIWLWVLVGLIIAVIVTIVIQHFRWKREDRRYEARRQRLKEAARQRGETIEVFDAHRPDRTFRG